MATNPKPTTVPLWDTSQSNLVVPSGGQISQGWVLAQVPPSYTFNYLDYWNGQWDQFVDSLFSDGGNAAGMAVGNMDLSSPAATSQIPIAKFRDYGNNIRALIDHNGYRMGQVTEKDEHWSDTNTILAYPLTSAVPGSATAGGWGATSGVWSTAATTTSGLLLLSLDGVVPAGAIITSIVFGFSRAASGDSLTFTYFTNVTGGGNTTRASKTITGASGVGSYQTTDLAVSPTSGSMPQQCGFGGGSSATESLLIVNATTTGGASLYNVTITYYMPTGWTMGLTTVGSSSSGDSIAPADPQSGLNHRGIRLFGSAISGVAGAATLTTKAAETYADSNCAYAMEFYLKVGTFNDGSAHRLFRAGVTQATSGNFIGLYNDNTLTNWQLNIAGTNFDSGIAINAFAFLIRIEILGANVNVGGASPLIRLYINGTKTNEVTAGSISADKISPSFSAATNGTTGGPYDITIGRLRRVWNHNLAGVNL